MQCGVISLDPQMTQILDNTDEQNVSVQVGMHGPEKGQHAILLCRVALGVVDPIPICCMLCWKWKYS